jgi:peptidoglycan hydrolase CwlO-like protein
MADITTTIVGGGITALLAIAVTFIRYGTRLSILERLVETSQLTDLHPRLTVAEATLQEMRNAVSKLATLDILNAKLDTVHDKVDSLEKAVDNLHKRTD